MRAVLLFLASLVTACSTPREQTSAVETPPEKPLDGGTAGFFGDLHGCSTSDFFGQAWIDSNHGAYGVRIAPEPSAFPDNEAFRFEVWITRTTIPGAPLESVSLSVDAAMPQHGHGMNRVPRVSRLEPGHFLVEGMYFHMTGKWELYLDITDGALTERAQCVVELADE